MESFGKNLRQQREAKSISLKEVAQSTMIKPQFLEALENDDYKNLPHPTFVKGFLRAYAKYVGLNAEELISDYEHSLMALQENEDEKKLKKETLNIKLAKEKKSSTPLFLIIIFVLLVIIALILAWQKFKGEKPEFTTYEPKALVPAPPAPKEIPPQAIEETPPENGGLTEAPKPPESVENAPAQVQKPPVSKLRLEIRARENCWFLVKADSGNMVDFILKSGETKVLEAQESFFFQTIGNIGGITFNLNGKTLPLGGQSGQVIHNIKIDKNTDLEALTRGFSG